jgi:hypothetical protein
MCGDVDYVQLAQTKDRWVRGFNEHRDEPSGLIKGGTSWPGQLKNCQLLKPTQKRLWALILPTHLAAWVLTSEGSFPGSNAAEA